MIKTLTNVLKQDKEKFTVPKKVQDIIPVRSIWTDGIFMTGKNKYSKMYRFTDINYAVASRDDKEGMFLGYSELLNSLDSGCTAKLTINNRRLNMLDFEDRILIKMLKDMLDVYRKEYNDMLTDKATGSNAIIQDKYITISVSRKSIEDARLYFARIGADLAAHFSRLGSRCIEMTANDRLRIIHDFFRTGEETSYHFDLKDHMRKGHDFRDYICPDVYENNADCFKVGNRFGRVLLLRDYASYISDDMVAEITDLSRNMMLSIDIVPIPTDEAVKEVEQRLLGVETNITNWQRRQNMNNNFSAVIPYDMEQQRKETKEFLDDLTTRDQRMMFAVLTLVHTADTKKQLDNDTEEILTIVRKRLCQMSVLKYQQLDGLKTALPFGVRKIDAFRTLTTESLAVFMPFRVQEVYDSHGIYYGNNVISKNMIIADRRRLMNGNSFILGVPGGGKSFTAKNEIVNLMLSGDADIIIIDPESEYGPLVRALGGSVINISANSPNHINAMDMSRDYGETDPIIEKSQFLQSLCEQIVAGHKFQKGQQSIIDRCTENVYRYYKQGNYQGTPPTLADFREELLKQPEPEAHSLALELELFTRGSLNTFAKQTNVDTSNRLICYDILELGEQLRAIGMLVILDSILNRITQNRQAGKRTYIFIDEIYLLFMHEYSAQFLYKLWKRVRKYGALCTGITQNVADLLQSYTARTMLSNSEFIVMLNQAATDRIELAKLLNISNEQLSYITNVDAGHGLLKVGSNLVPFENKFPKDTKLYALMTSKFGEGYFAGNANVPTSQIGKSAGGSDEQEILKKIREVSMNNSEFDEMVKRYMNEA
ncbi:MAG: ATP-binding protein [Oscillospiraceae bacterium]|nr:ATP-binding protein [Oscillospiraceae bacterium]